MGDHDDEFVLRDFLDEVHDLNRGHRIQGAGRFVGEEDVGFVDEGPGDGDALALAAGKLIGFLRVKPFKTDIIQGLFGPGDAFFFLEPGDRERQFNVFQNRFVGDQVIGLEDEADPVVAVDVPIVAGELFRGDAVDDQIAGSAVVEAADDIERGRLPAARRAEDRDEFIFPEAKRNALQCLHFQSGSLVDFHDAV